MSVRCCKKKGWMLGGEPSGHVICRDLVSTGDGTIAALKVISSLLILEKDPEDILRNYTKMPQININVEVKNKDVLSDSDIQKKIKEIESDLTVGRVLVRPSGTESKIRVMVESDDEITATKYAKDIATIITGTMARPSRPSVRFTELAEPIIIKTPIIK